MRLKRPISKTPRSDTHSRKVHFSLAMRKKISGNWIAVRKGMKKKK